MVESKLAQQYSEEKLGKLMQWLRDQQTPSEYNHIYIVENIRSLTEFLIYGEKYGKDYFEQFIDENVLLDIARFLQFNNRLVSIQIIQTISMLIQNLETQSRVYYLLGNPFLNQLI